MKKLLLLIFLVGIFASCSKKQGPVLHVYNWSDYIKDDLVKRFEKETGIKIIMDYFDSNESMYAKLKAGATGYDVVFPSSYMTSIMHNQGMLEKLDYTKLPNIKNIDHKFEKFSEDPEMDHSVPYMISTAGIGYLNSKVDEDFEVSWKVFGDPKFKGRMTMLNDMRESLGAALKYLGFSLNTLNESELEKARDLLINWKKNLAKFESESYKPGLVSEEFFVVHGYSGDVFQLMEENEDVVYAIPKEGTSLSSDDMVILKNAPNKDGAYKFLNFLMDAEVAAENTEYIWYLAPNIPSYELLSDEIKNDPTVFLKDDIIANSEAIKDLGEGNALYSKIWDEVKAAT